MDPVSTNEPYPKLKRDNPKLRLFIAIEPDSDDLDDDQPASAASENNWNGPSVY